MSSQRAAKLAAAGAATSGRSPAAPQDQQHQHTPHTPHSHSSFVSASFSSSQPLCMACFQAFVSQSMLPATQLFRAKGFVWFEQQRGLHYIFHVSGKQRAECGATGKWQGPPGVQLVLIGQDQTVLLQLKQQLQDCMAAACPCDRTDRQAAGRQAEAAAVHQNGAQPVPLLQPQCNLQRPAGNSNIAAARFAQLVQGHHRFELWGQQQQQQQQPPDVQEQTAVQPEQQEGAGAAAAAAAGAAGLVEFSALGSALHGVNAEEVRELCCTVSACCFPHGDAYCVLSCMRHLRLSRASNCDVTCLVAISTAAAVLCCRMAQVNAALLRKANATSGLTFLCHQKSPPALRTAAASSQQVAYQGVLALQLCFRAGDSAAEAEEQWQRFETAVAPVLRKAYQHVHNCKCDVVELVTAL